MMRRLLILLTACLSLLSETVPAAGQFKKAITPGQYDDQVTSMFAQHRWDKGKELLDEGLDRYPNDPNLHYLAGRYWYHVKNYDRARFHLTKSCEINYNHIDAKNLLVNVEELSGNYSSAICYVNELLEINPYWKGLWLRKIDLYKKQGNFAEANELLKRLRQIYPNDASISSDWFDVLETTYNQARLSGDLTTAEDALRDMVRIYPNDPDYQLAYANVLIQLGRREEALSVLNAALNVNPGNVDLTRKAAGLLMESGQDKAASALVRAQISENPSPELRTLSKQILEENARFEKESDPYILYSKVYATQRSSEALNFLVNEAYRRGYNEDALEYIAEKRKHSGNTPGLCMMEYEVRSRMGHPEDARNILMRAEKEFPDSYDINLAASRIRLKDAAEAMNDELYDQAAETLEYVRTNSLEPEFVTAATRRLATCYRELGNFDKAEQMLKERLKNESSTVVSRDYASLLVKQGRRDEALEELYRAYWNAPDSTSRQSIVYMVDEIAIPMIKDAKETGANPYATKLCNFMLSLNPANYWALRYGCQTAEDPAPYIEAGVENYPEDISFRIRKAHLLEKEGKEDEAREMLLALMDEHPGDESLVGAYALASRLQAEKLIGAKDYDGAAALLDSALAVRPLDKELQYARGLIYEKNKQWDSAYVYQSKYTPSLLEQKEYLDHMRSMRSRTYNNTLEFGYYFYQLTASTTLNGIATVGYSHRTPKGFLLGTRINYSGRNAFSEGYGEPVTGSRALQWQAFTSIPVSKSWEFNGDVAVGYRFFPVLSLNAAMKHTSASELELEFGGLYRKMPDGANMIGATFSPAKSLGKFYLSGKVSAGTYQDYLYALCLVRTRFFPYEGGRTYIEAQAGAGSAPELDFSNIYYNAYSYNHLNSFVGLGANWLLTDNLSLNISGSWHTLYGVKNEELSYNNMLVGNVQFVIYF